jgi:uncharacterized protein (AIM24 family)
VAGEDFLFHLYRGSELLQDNRVHDAKAELEQALRFQPSDPKGQDLLGIVYFRLGLYPRAIAIYERLVQSHPDAIEPRVNLALSYLKTGQAQAARFELERVVEQSPGHSRAWGYLGLAFQRLGDYERASHAFAAGGHDAMARRLLDMASQAGAAPPTATPSLIPEANAHESRRPPPMSVDVHSAISAHEEKAALEAPRVPTGAWTALEGEAVAHPSVPPPAPPEETPTVPKSAMVPPPAALPSIAEVRARMTDTPSTERPRASAPVPVAQALRDALVVFPRALPIAVHPSGLVLVQATDGFAVKLDAVRSMTLAAPAGEALPRRVRGRVTDEPLGGPNTPILMVPGKSEISLGAPKGFRLAALVIGDEPLYLREDLLAGFETSVTYENGRLPSGDGDAIAMVQLRGPGTIVASLPEVSHAIEVMEGRNSTVRAPHVVAWSGRLLPRALFASEAPAGARGLVAFTGEGMVLLDGRG